MAKKPKGEEVLPASPDRPTQIKAVLALIEDGTSERAACEQVGINRATFRAAALREGAGDQYAGALAALAGDQVEKLEQAIQDMRAGIIDAAMARVEIDARKWFASKFLPRRYGDKVQLAGDPENPVNVRTSLSESALEALAAMGMPERG